MSRRLKLTLVGSLIFGLVAGLALALIEFSYQRYGVIIEQDASYALYTREEMIDLADAIFVGKVISISPTQWNQDSGEEWNDDAIGGDSGLQVHYLKLEVVESFVDTIGLDQQVTITRLGRSPVDGYSEDDLKEELQAVFFVTQADLAWRGGQTRPILELVGVPTDAYFQLGDDGLYYGRPDEQPLSLKDIIRQVAQRRATLVQP